MQTCPGCGSELTRRVSRAWWMRLFFPKSVALQCAACGERSTLLRGERRALSRHDRH